MSESPLTPLSDSTSPAHQKKINQHDSFDSIYDGLDDQDPIGVGVYEGTRKNTRGFNGNSSAEKEEMGKEDGEISDTSGDGYKEDQEMRDSSFGSDIEEEQKEGETAYLGIGEKDTIAERDTCQMVEAEVVEENEPSQIMLADNSSRYDAPPPFAIPSHPRPLDSQSNCSSSDPALFVYRFTLPAASLLSLLIGCRGTTVKRTSEQAGVVIHYHGSFEPPYSLFSPPSPTPPHGIIQGDVYGIKCALDYIKLDLQRSNCTYSREQALCSNLDFLEFDPQKLEHLTEKNKLSPPNNRRSSNDSGHGWRESRSERRTSDTGFAAQAYDESESLGPPPSRTRTVSPQAYRSNPARALFSRPLDNSPSLSSQSSAYPVNQQFTSRQSPSPIRKKLSIRRQRSRSPSPARPYSSRRPSKSQSPPRRPCQASSRPSLSISTAYQESESQNREIEEENKKGRSKMSSKTKQEQKSFAFEIPLIAIPSFYGPQSSLPHLERISQSKLKLECETTSARLVVLASDGTVKNFEKLKNGIEDVVRIAEGCENWSIRGKEEDQEMSPPAATSSLDAESGTYRFPSPISLQPQSRNAESRPRSLSHSRSRSTSVTAQTSRRSEDAPMRGREQVERSMSCDRLRNERGKRTATKLESRPEDEKRGRRRSRSQNWSGARRGRDRSRSKDRLVEKRARSRSPKSTYSSITPQNGRYGSVGFERSAPRQTPIASRSPARTALPHLTSQSSRPRRMSPARLDSPPHHSAILSRPPPPSSASYPSHDEPKFAPPSSITNYIGQPIHLTLNEEDRRRFEEKEQFERRMREEAQSWRQRQRGRDESNRWSRDERTRSPEDERRVVDRGRKDREFQHELERSRRRDSQGDRFCGGEPRRTRHRMDEDVRRAF